MNFKSKLFYGLKNSLMTVFLFSLLNCTESQSNEPAENETVSNEIPKIIEDELSEIEQSIVSIDPRTQGGAKVPDQEYIDQQALIINEAENPLLGSYVGKFGNNSINITITKTSNFKAEGYSVCAGNFRQLNGSYDLMEDDHYTFTLNEPGSDQYDGVFQFTLDESDKLINGKWTPYKAEGNSSKKYELHKRHFDYDPSVGRYPEASSRELTANDLENLDFDQLTEMRNEIYARHGLSFKDKQWRSIFEAYKWYMPMGIDLRDKLTDIEVMNIELIYEYESYFDAYYDDFGR